MAVVCLAAVALAAIVSWLTGRQHALRDLAVIDVSASAAARAMQDDHFYSDYEGKVLVIHGTVASIQTTSGGRQITLRTDSTFGLTCATAGPAEAAQPSVGSVVSLIAIGGNAVREPSAVLLPVCRFSGGL